MDNYTQNTGHEIGWEDEISQDGGQFILLEEGDYNFTVTGFERGRFPGSAKIPACNKASLTLSVDTPEGGASVKYDLILWSSLEWKISEFFRAIGQKKSGEAFIPKWNSVVGSHGRARFKPRTYEKKDGTKGEANDVDRFYDYDPAFFQGLQSAAQASATPVQTQMPLPPAPSATWHGKF